MKKSVLSGSRWNDSAFLLRVRQGAVVLLSLLLTVGSHAQVVWSGTTANAAAGVTAAANWDGGVLPNVTTPFSDIAFGLSGLTTVNVPTSLTVGNITFSNTSPTPRPDYTFSGQNAAKLTLSGNITVNPSGGAGGNGNVTVDSTLPFALTQGSHTASVATGSTLAIASSVGNSIDAIGSIAKTGGGTLTLTGPNTYSGTTTISEGTVVANKIVASSGNSSLGNATSAVVLGDASHTGTLSYTGTSATYTRGFTVNAGGGEVDITTGAQTLTIATGGVAAAGAFTIGGAGSASISSVISGAGSLNKIGAGTLTLSGTNTYSGATNIGSANASSGGTLTLGASNVIPNASTVNVYAGTLNISNRTETIGALNLGGGANNTVASVIGSGTLTLGGGLTYNATNTGGGATISANLTLGASRTFTVGDSTPAADLTISSIIDDGGSTFSLTKAGAGTLVLTGANSYDGGTTISAGTLQLGNGGSTGSLSTSGGISISSGATLAINRSSDLTLANSLSGAGAIVKSAANTLTLTGSNSGYTGTLTFSTGTVALDPALSTSNTRGTGTWLVSGDATLDLTATGTITNPVLRTGGTNFADTSSLVAKNSYAIGGTSSLSFFGAAGLTASGANVIVGGTQTFGTHDDSAPALGGGKTFSLGNFTALDDTTVGNILKTQSGLTVDRLSSNNTITGGAQTFNGYSSLQANHSGALAAGSVQVFNDNTHLRLGRSVTGGAIVTGGTQTFNGNSFLWAKLATGETGPGVSGGDQAFHNNSSFVAAMANAITGGNQTFDSNATLTANVTGAITGGNQTFSGNATFNANAPNSTGAVTITLQDTSSIRAGAANSLGAATEIYFSGVNNGAGGKLVLNGFDTTVGEIASGSITNAHPGTIQNGSAVTAATLSVGANNQSSVFNGTIENGAGALPLSLVKQGQGTLTLGGANTFTGTTVINSGSGALTLNNALALSGSTLDYSKGSGGLTFGTLSSTLASVTLGGLKGDKDLSLGSYSSAAENNVSLALTVGGNGGSTTYSGVLSDANASHPGASLTKTGAGTLTLSGLNTYTGPTTINNGTLEVSTLANGGAASGLGKSSTNRANLVLAGGTLRYTGAATSTDRSFKLGGSGGTIDASGTGALTFNGDDFIGFVTPNTATTLTLSGSSTAANTLSGLTLGDNGTGLTSLMKQGTGLWVLSGSNTFTGATTLAGGTLQLGSSDALSSGTDVNLSFGNTLLDLNGFNAVVGSIAGVTASVISIGSGSLATTDDNSTTFAGNINGGGSLTKGGAGTLTLSGSNNYNGGTTINGGELTLTSSAMLNSAGDVVINNSGTFHDFAPNQVIRALSSSSPTSNVIIETGATLTSNMPDSGAGSTSKFAGLITGDGSFLKNGGGNSTLTLTGVIGLSGTTTVDTGTLQVGDGGTSGAIVSNVTVNNTGILDFNRSDAVTFSAMLAGSGTLIKDGGSTLTLNNSLNTFNGNVVVNGGTLALANDIGVNSLTGAGATTIASGRTLSINNVGAVTPTTYAGVISGGGSLALMRGNLTLSGVNTYTGFTNINSGTQNVLNIGVDNALPNGFVSVGSGATLNVLNNQTVASLNSTGTVTVAASKVLTIGNGGIFSSVISGSGGVTFNNPTTITAAESYSGSTTITNGTLAIGNGGATGSVAGNVNLASNANKNSVAFNRTDAVTFAGVISGTGSLVKMNSNALTLTGHSTFAGTTSVGSGTLVIGNNNALPTTTQLSLGPGATLDVSSFDQTIAGFGPSAVNSSILIGLNQTLTLAMPQSTFTSFPGDINGSGTFAANGTDVVVNLTGNVANTITKSPAPGVTLVVGNAPFTITTALAFGGNTSNTLSNPISGSGSVIATSGSLTLTSPSTYTGGTTVSGGKLIVNNSSGSGTGTGPVDVTSGGLLGGSGFISGPVTLNAGSTIAPGNSPGTLTVGAATFAANATFAFDLNSATGVPGVNWDYLNITGGLTITSTSAAPFLITLTSLNGLTAGTAANFNSAQAYQWKFLTASGGITGFTSPSVFSINSTGFQNAIGPGGFFFVSQAGNDLFVNFSPVPEPSTWALLATGLGALGFVVLRRRRV